MDGAASIICQHDGSWTKSPKCLKRCAIPALDNINLTSITHFSFTDGSTVTIICDDNANLIGNSTITCYNGTWTNPPECEIFKCDPPALKPHITIETVAIYQVNTTYNLTCEMGYHKDADLSQSAHCNAKGEWEMEGNCFIDSCGLAPDVHYSSHTGSSYLYHEYFYNDTLFYT